MKRISFRPIAFAALLALAGAVALSAQTFQKYVALGDSLTAGWQSGCLVQRNQINSYPAVLARTLGVGDFQLPLVQEVALTNPPGTACLGAVFIPPATVTVAPVSQMDGPLNALLPRPYDDLGIPGAHVKDLLDLTHGDPNGSDLEKLSALILRNVPGSPFDGTNAVQQADLLIGGATGPTLATLWIGNNDVLGPATSGIVVDGVTLTSLVDFTASYQGILAALLPSNLLVAANIPDVTALPFSTTIPPILVNPTTRQPVIINGSTVPLLGAGDDAFPCTPVPPDQGCPLPAGTLVNLPASALLGLFVGIPVGAGGTGLPLPHGHIDATGPHGGVTLYPDEVSLLQQRTNEYNQVIADSLPAGAIVVDIHTRFSEIRADGYHVGGLTLTTAFLTGGIFSYDGVHPSSTGYMLVADEFILAMNANGGSFPRPDFSSILFTPNVPAPAAAIQDGGPWSYNFGMWGNLLDSIPTLKGISVQLPSLPAQRPVRGRTSVVTRGQGD